MSKALTKAPATCEVIANIKRILSQRQITGPEFRRELNSHLPPSRQIEDTHPGMVQIYRWLSTDNDSWPEPKAEIVLSMKRFIEKYI